MSCRSRQEASLSKHKLSYVTSFVPQTGSISDEQVWKHWQEELPSRAVTHWAPQAQYVFSQTSEKITSRQNCLNNCCIVRINQDRYTRVFYLHLSSNTWLSFNRANPNNCVWEMHHLEAKTSAVHTVSL